MTLVQTLDDTNVDYPAVIEGLSRTKIGLYKGSLQADLVWFDGLIPKRRFFDLDPLQGINKISGMDFLCYKSNTFAALNMIKFQFPKLNQFIPQTFLLPAQLNELRVEHRRLNQNQLEPCTWIVKPRAGSCGNGIKLCQSMAQVAEVNYPSIVQSYIPPFIYEGRKFDFRFYAFISSLKPLTVFIYKEGIARFCTSTYLVPTRENLENKFVHLTNTAVNNRSTPT
jgi:hypothetical protein